MNYKTIAIIPARGGSKRIPRKNIKMFLGQPIIKYSIDAALKSKCFNEVMVSTDDKEIAAIAIKAGAKVPFFRSAKTSDDSSGLLEVITEVLEEYKKQGIKFDLCCCLLPTAPFISPQRLCAAKRLLQNPKVDQVVTITKYMSPIQRALCIKNGQVKMISPKYYHRRSQDLSSTYYDCGQFFWLKCNVALPPNNNFFKRSTAGMEIPELESQDINTLEEWSLAELKYKLLHYQ